MNKSHLILIFLTIQILVSAFACTKKEGKQAQTASPQEGSQSAVSSQQRSSGNLAVRLIPDSPSPMRDLEVQADLPSAGPVSYQWKRNGQIIAGEYTSRLAKNQFSPGDEITAIVTAGSNEGTISVVIGNNFPRIVSVPFSPEYVHAGVDITVAPVGSSPTGDEVKFHYKWSVNGTPLPDDTPVLRGNLYKRGDSVTLTVVPYDRSGEGEPFNSKKIVIPDAPPQIVSTPPQNIQTDTYSYQVMAEDPDGDSLTFSLTAAPSGMTIDSKTGLITWQIKTVPAGVYNVEVAVQDSEGRQGTQKYSIPIDTPEGEKK